jgi:hypothetical protein
MNKMTKKQQELRILELELALQQSRHTIRFLHGCLTEPNFSYEYPDQTFQILDRIEKLCPPQKLCIHSGFNEDCESCVERVETMKRLKRLKEENE